VAKNLLSHPLRPTLYDNPILPYDYKNWCGNHIWLSKGPVPLWSMAIAIKIFGNNDFGIRIPSIIVSIFSIYLTFLIGKTLFDKRIGLLSAFFHSVNGLLIEVAGGRESSDHIETFFIFFIELAIYFSIIAIHRNKKLFFSILIGVSTGFAILSKWLPATLVFPIWIISEIIIAKKLKYQIIGNLLLSVFSCLIVILPWIIYINYRFPNEAHWLFRQFIFPYFSIIEQHNGPFYFYFQNIGMVFGEIIWIPITISIYQLVHKQVDWRMIYLILWWCLPFVVFSFAATKRLTYLLIAAPSFFIINSYYWFYIRDNFKKWKIIRIIILTLLIILPVRYFIERLKPFTKIERTPEWALELKQMNNKYDLKTVFFNYDHCIEGMYYTSYIFYAGIPSDNVVAMLKKRGYKISIKN
jgi:4-amino-4-deoxy-L-arabinose transferase